MWLWFSITNYNFKKVNESKCDKVGQNMPLSLQINGYIFVEKATSTHCSNPEVRIREKMLPKFETAVRTLMKRASKRAPT